MSKDNELPEIDSIRVYQAVTFEGKSETFFSHRPINQKSACTISVNKEFLSVEIKTKRDHIMVPFANISCVYFLSEIRKEQIAKSEAAIAKDVGVGSKIKRPR